MEKQDAITLTQTQAEQADKYQKLAKGTWKNEVLVGCDFRSILRKRVVLKLAPLFYGKAYKRRLFTFQKFVPFFFSLKQTLVQFSIFFYYFH